MNSDISQDPFDVADRSFRFKLLWMATNTLNFRALVDSIPNILTSAEISSVKAGMNRLTSIF
jgi:hypothetical protein